MQTVNSLPNELPSAFITILGGSLAIELIKNNGYANQSNPVKYGNVAKCKKIENNKFNPIK